MEKKDGIRVAKHNGTFYIVKTFYWQGNVFHLLESEQYGEDAYHVCVRDDGTEVLSGVDQLDGEREVIDFLEENPVYATFDLEAATFLVQKIEIMIDGYTDLIKMISGLSDKDRDLVMNAYKSKSTLLDMFLDLNDWHEYLNEWTRDWKE